MRVDKATVVNALPPFKNKTRVATWRQSVPRLMAEIMKAHDGFAPDYEEIYQYFDTGDLCDTCSELWNFCKINMPYTIEGEHEQSVKSPGAILAKGQKIDCKHYSLFIGGVLSAIRDNYNEPWGLCYRFASYDNSKIPEHVFIVAADSKRDYWVDPVLTSFNQRKQPTFFVDEIIEPMPVYTISGINDSVTGNASPVIEIYNTDLAEARFFALVNDNLFGLKTILNSDRTVLYSRVKNYFDKNGFDFNHLLLILGQ